MGLKSGGQNGWSDDVLLDARSPQLLPAGGEQCAGGWRAVVSGARLKPRRAALLWRPCFPLCRVQALPASCVEVRNEGRRIHACQAVLTWKAVFLVANQVFRHYEAVVERVQSVWLGSKARPANQQRQHSAERAQANARGAASACTVLCAQQQIGVWLL